MSFKRTALYTTVSAICLGGPIPSFAAREGVLEEVIVTARKQEEEIQTTPVAVTALSENMLTQAQVLEIGDLQKTAPNLSIMEGGTGSSALVFISIRGQAQTAPNAAADAAVGTYIDGVYFARPTGGNLDMFDIQQVEVLRGPQGTLFGRNTTGGAISITTNKPTGEWEGYLKGDGGNYDQYRVEGVLNTPILGEELGARFAARYGAHDGYGDYKGYSDPNGFEWEGLHQEGSKVDKNEYYRANLAWQPSDKNFGITASGWYTQLKDSGQRTEVQGINTGFSAGGTTLGGLMAASGFDPNNFLKQQSSGDAYWNADNTSQPNPAYTWNYLSTPRSTNENKGGLVDIYFESGDYLLKSITSYMQTNSSGTVDLDGTPVNLLTFNSNWNQNQWSQEFQLTGQWGDKFNWITGLYYFNESSSGLAISRAFSIFSDIGLAGVPLPPGAVNIESLQPQTANTNTQNDNTSKAVYMQGNYDLNEAMRLTAGLRWTRDDRNIQRSPFTVWPTEYNPDRAANCALTVEERDNPDVCKKTQSTNFDYPAWILSLDYQYSDDVFLYAKTSGASMAGGWNVRGSQLPDFDPEDVADVEVGSKLDLLDKTLRFNTALFYIWSQDQQRIVNEFIPETGNITQYVRNASESETYGAEVELTWLPWEGMTITSNIAYLHSEYQKYDVNEQVTTGPNAGEIVTVDHSGEHAPHAPEWNYGIGATQYVETSLGELELHADYYWVDDTWFQDNTVNTYEGEGVQEQQRQEKKYNAIPSYDLVNAIATLRTKDQDWEFSIWGKNLLDEDYYTGVSNFYSAFGTAMWYWGAPRTYGASVKYNWN